MCAPSPHCSANAGMWLTTTVLVYDIAVEVHYPHRFKISFLFHLDLIIHACGAHI